MLIERECSSTENQSKAPDTASLFPVLKANDGYSPNEISPDFSLSIFINEDHSVGGRCWSPMASELASHNPSLAAVHLIRIGGSLSSKFRSIAEYSGIRLRFSLVLRL